MPAGSWVRWRRARGGGPELPNELSQEHRRTETDDAVEPSERPIRHEEVYPGVQAEAATQQMAGRDLVRGRHLELESLDTQLGGSTFDVEQDVGQVDRIKGGDRTDPALAQEGETDDSIFADIQVAFTIFQKPADFIFPTSGVED
jgi:hypothetical protein